MAKKQKTEDPKSVLEWINPDMDEECSNGLGPVEEELIEEEDSERSE